MQKWSHSKTKNNQGFTLLEIVVSLGILALGVLGIFSLIPTGVDQSIKVQEQSKALLLAQSKMEEIMSYASEDWKNFYSMNHYNSSFYQPKFVGPNSDYERKTWGWVKQDDTSVDDEYGYNNSWVPNLGYQWEWHFVGDITAFPNRSIALITLSVYWPQSWSQQTTAAGIPTQADEQNYVASQLYDRTYLMDNNIQFIRLVSYVSKGL